eukprot:Sspe_Gene.89719::Locus_61412_Transcript_1_1_Confidence_1.000_Length_1475::g.89719::m.89719
MRPAPPLVPIAAEGSRAPPQYLTPTSTSSSPQEKCSPATLLGRVMLGEPLFADDRINAEIPFLELHRELSPLEVYATQSGSSQYAHMREAEFTVRWSPESNMYCITTVVNGRMFVNLRTAQDFTNLLHDVEKEHGNIIPPALLLESERNLNELTLASCLRLLATLDEVSDTATFVGFIVEKEYQSHATQKRGLISLFLNSSPSPPPPPPPPTLNALEAIGISGSTVRNIPRLRSQQPATLTAASACNDLCMKLQFIDEASLDLGGVLATEITTLLGAEAPIPSGEAEFPALDRAVGRLADGAVLAKSMLDWMAHKAAEGREGKRPDTMQTARYNEKLKSLLSRLDDTLRESTIEVVTQNIARLDHTIGMWTSVLQALEAAEEPLSPPASDVTPLPRD